METGFSSLRIQKAQIERAKAHRIHPAQPLHEVIALALDALEDAHRCPSGEADGPKQVQDVQSGG